MTQVGCLIASLGLAALAVAMFGLRHVMIAAAGDLPVLPGLAANFTWLARLLVRQAAASISVEAAAVLIGLGMWLLYQSNSPQD
jgi:hypothetical protein